MEGLTMEGLKMMERVDGMVRGSERARVKSELDLIEREQLIIQN